MAFYLNKKQCIISVPYGETKNPYNPVTELVHLKPMQPELVVDEIEADFLKNAKEFIDDGFIVKITDEEANKLLQEWENKPKKKNYTPAW